MHDELGIGPYLKSRSIYDFSLDDKVLTIEDFDFILPSQDFLLPTGSYAIKQISKHAHLNLVGRVFRVNADGSSMNDAFSKGTPLNEASLITSGEKVILNVRPTGLLFSSSQPILLMIRYRLILPGKGRDLLYAGAIQPSDYQEFNTYFRDIVPARYISKEIVVTSRSKDLYHIRCYEGSDPIPFPNGELGNLSRLTKHFEHRWSTVFYPGRSPRASYFAVATMKLDSTPPRPMEILAEDPQA